MKKIAKPEALSNLLSSRYGLAALDCDGWNEVELVGGVGMDEPTFAALASAATEWNDMSATIYELESTNIEFAPITIRLDFNSFNFLKHHIMSHFDSVMIPASKAWAALLTSELETFVCGPDAFLAAVSINLAGGLESASNQRTPETASNRWGLKWVKKPPC